MYLPWVAEIFLMTGFQHQTAWFTGVHNLGLKAGPRYDAGGASIANVMGESIFFTSQIQSWCQQFGQSDWLSAD